MLALVALALAGFVAAVAGLTHGGGVSGVLAAVLRFVRYAGSLGAVGALGFLLLVRPGSVPPTRTGLRVAAAAAGAAAVASALSLPVHAAYLAGDLASISDPAALAAAAESGVGASAAVGLVGLALVGLALRWVGQPLAVGAGAAGAMLALGAFLLTGHTVTAEPRALVVSASLTHVVAGSVWLGGLVLLFLTVRERRAADDVEGAARVVARFSTTATVALVAVAAAGGALAWVEVRALQALATTYGATLSAKVALVGAVVALAAYNNRRLVPAIRAGVPRPWARLDRIVRLEAVGLVAVVAVTAVLVNITPARVEAGIDAQETRIAAFGEDHTATVVVEPSRPGSNEVHLYIEHDQGALGDAISEVSIAFVPPGADEAATTVTPAQVAPEHWLHLGSELDASGQWRLRVDGEVDGQPESVTVTIPVTTAEEWAE